MPSLKEQQKRLPLNIIHYDLEQMWSSHSLIQNLREKVIAFLPKNDCYDPQDLEHQALFRLTTFDPKDITDEIIQMVVNEQYLIVKKRLKDINYDTKHLFRGLTGTHQDLNINDRLNLCWKDDALVAKNKHRSFNVEFRIVHDENIVSLFSNELHYIHRGRPKGEVFGFYFSDDEIPWAIETTEPSTIAKQYKRDALLANGIDPNKAVELTRFYTLPGAPTNAISLMDGLVARYYKQKGIEALYTTTMPMYSKTKSTTIAGGINKPLLVKDLRHKFIPENIQGKTCYRHVTTIPEDHKESSIIKTHPNFPTMLVVEVFRTLDGTELKPLPILQSGEMTIYVAQRDTISTEKEVKIKIDNISNLLKKIRSIAGYVHTEYIRDIIYGAKGESKKIRLRIEDNLEHQSLEATHKYKIAVEEGVKKEIEEIVYKGNSFEDAVKMINLRGDFKEENSYEKVRILYEINDTKLTIDIYPFGSWLEIEGEINDIHAIAKKLGYTQKDYIDQGADELYLDWIKKHSLPEMWDVRFGLDGKK